MEYVDLNKENLEITLGKLNFSGEEVQKIRKDSRYFDRYILIQERMNIGFLTVLRQPFSDPYLDLTFDECDLLNYRGTVSIESFLDVMDNIFQIPQITRCSESNKESFLRRGFQDIKERLKYKGSSKLIPIRFELSQAQQQFLVSPNIRSMNESDLEAITNLFFDEYRIRFRAVKRMYKIDPSSCFVYEQDGVIKGVIFGEKIDKFDVFYIHQLLIRKAERGKGVDKSLLNYVIGYTKNIGFNMIKGIIRANLIPYYFRISAIRDSDVEAQQYIIRFEIKR